MKELLQMDRSMKEQSVTLANRVHNELQSRQSGVRSYEENKGVESDSSEDNGMGGLFD